MYNYVYSCVRVYCFARVLLCFYVNNVFWHIFNTYIHRHTHIYVYKYKHKYIHIIYIYIYIIQIIYIYKKPAFLEQLVTDCYLLHITLKRLKINSYLLLEHLAKISRWFVLGKILIKCEMKEKKLLTFLWLVVQFRASF